MQLEELKLITASNIINLRTRAGLTQAELGAKLNYSDKTISKWERAEAIPDAFVLKQMGEIFGVTVDNLLSSHDEWKPIPTEEPETVEVSYSTNRIIAITVIGVWTLRGSHPVAGLCRGAAGLDPGVYDPDLLLPPEALSPVCDRGLCAVAVCHGIPPVLSAL